jgi:hypothetical protein
MLEAITLEVQIMMMILFVEGARVPIAPHRSRRRPLQLGRLVDTASVTPSCMVDF